MISQIHLEIIIMLRIVIIIFFLHGDITKGVYKFIHLSIPF